MGHQVSNVDTYSSDSREIGIPHNVREKTRLERVGRALEGNYSTWGSAQKTDMGNRRWKRASAARDIQGKRWKRLQWFLALFGSLNKGTVPPHESPHMFC